MSAFNPSSPPIPTSVEEAFDHFLSEGVPPLLQLLDAVHEESISLDPMHRLLMFSVIGRSVVAMRDARMNGGQTIPASLTLASAAVALDPEVDAIMNSVVSRRIDERIDSMFGGDTDDKEV